IFHAVRLAAGFTLHDCEVGGWVIQPPEGSNNFWKLWDMYNLQDGLGGIYWPAVWQQGPKLAGLFVVVCFGSCMDMAAIQQEMPLPLDFNSELVTVGLSNALVGLLGAGFTGSYIFSQTIFTMRAGVRNRLAGIVLAAAELSMFALPFSVIQYCPSFLFGALLLWFGVEICRDWLVLSYKKLSGPEYLLLWLTFSAIMAAGLMEGIAAGVVAATLYFAYKYAQ
ncbi:putative sulfate transporter, partial [Haematococcus lacustris]